MAGMIGVLLIEPAEAQSNLYDDCIQGTFEIYQNITTGIRAAAADRTTDLGIDFAIGMLQAEMTEAGSFLYYGIERCHATFG